MAISSEPWRREGNNSWNDLVRRVNEVLENPPDNTDCDPIAPLPEIDAECHQWTTQDITDMQNALKEACDTNVFTPVVPCDKWEVSIIDEIEAAIVVGFCDCKTLDECVPSCDNQAFPEEIFIKSVVEDKCTESFGLSCSAAASASTILFSEYLDLQNAFDLVHAELCVLEEEVADLQEELDALQEQLDDLTTQKNTECIANPGSALCISLTAAVSAKQVEVDEKQTELDDKTAERNVKSAEEALERTAMVAKANETVTNAKSAIQDVGEEPFIDLVSLNEPWTNFECDDPLRMPACSGRDASFCKTSWSLQRRVFQKISKSLFFGPCDESLAPGFPKDFSTVLQGTTTLDGSLVVRPFGGCVSVSETACFSTNCSGGICPPCQTVESITTEYRLLVSRPFPTSPFACNTGVPCTPGENP